MQITHTRPVGGPNYDELRALGTTPGAELHRLFRKYAIPPDIKPAIGAAIEIDGALLSDESPADAEALRRIHAADMRAFVASRLSLDLPRTLVARTRLPIRPDAPVSGGR